MSFIDNGHGSYFRFFLSPPFLFACLSLFRALPLHLPHFSHWFSQKVLTKTQDWFFLSSSSVNVPLDHQDDATLLFSSIFSFCLILYIQRSGVGGWGLVYTMVFEVYPEGALWGGEVLA